MKTQTDTPEEIVETVDLYDGIEPNEIADMFKRIKKAIPDEIDDRFTAIGELEEKLQWEKGDLTNTIWANVNGKRLKNRAGRLYTFLDVCFYVSVRYLHGNRSYNTVKAWALTARHYSPKVRAFYNYDVIPFSHFAYAAKRVFDVPGENSKKVWQNVLDHSRDQSAKRGRDISVRELEHFFEGVHKSPNRYRSGMMQLSGEEATQPSVNVFDLPLDNNAPTLELEFAEEMHKLSALISRMTLRYPMYAGLLSQGFSILSNAFGQIKQTGTKLPEYP